MSKKLQLSLISVTLISSLHAQNQYTLDSIEVTASQGTALEKKDVTDSVTIITKEAIEESRVVTLDEALNKLGGVSMTNNGGVGQGSSMYVRGMSSKRILVLVDGVRQNNPTSIGAAAAISQITLGNVERIEIIKGAQSGVWGSDASGGVINVITSKAKKGIHALANLEYGSFNTLNATLQASYAQEEYDFTLGGTFYNTDGFSAAEPKQDEANYGKRFDELNLEEDSYSNLSLNAKFGYNFTQNDRFEFNARAIDASSDFDSGAGETKDSTIPNQKLQNSFYTLSFAHKDSINDLKLQYNLSTFDRTFELASWDGSGVDEYEYVGSVNELKIDDKIAYLKDSFIRVGASYQLFEQEEITTDADEDFSAISVFATNYNKLELLSNLNTILTESIRYDKYDNFDNSFTGKIGAKQFVYEDAYVSLNAGTGYNAPTLGQLYGAFGANPNLKPETSKTFDITLGNDTLWVTGFYNEIEDLIDYVITDYETYAGGYQQIEGKSKFKGVEVGYEDFFFDSIGVNGTYTYLETEDSDGAALARRPKTQLDAGATYYVSDEFDVSLNAQYIGERFDQKDEQGAQTGKYTVTNLVANYKAMDAITIYGKINNISDEYYQSVDGYASAERSFYLGLNAKY